MRLKLLFLISCSLRCFHLFFSVPSALIFLDLVPDYVEYLEKYLPFLRRKYLIMLPSFSILQVEGELEHKFVFPLILLNNRIC